MGNIYPPGEISDLTLGNMDFSNRSFELSFTSPGDDLDEGTIASYQIFFSANQTLISGDSVDESELTLVDEDYLACNCSFNPLPAPEVVSLRLNMDMFNVSQQVYFRVLCTDQGGKMSLSNIARLFLTEIPQPIQPVNYSPNLTVHFAILFAALL